MQTLEDMLAEGDALMARVGESMAEQGDELERAQRIDEARALSTQVPDWLRGQAEDLRLRISDDRLVDAVMCWEWGPNLLLMGPTGLGKTTAAALLWRRLVVRGVQAGGQEWARARRLVWCAAERLPEARARHPLGHGEVPEMAAAYAASLLVLDDLDQEKAVRPWVSRILKSRYDAGAPTVLTTGLDARELTETFGAAIVRRMRETGGQRALVVDAFKAPPGRVSGAPTTDGKTAAAGGCD